MSVESLEEPLLSVSDFVAVFNQTLEFAYPSVLVTGELSNFRVSKNRWVYFDIKDEAASVKCFGTVYQLPGPLEDGMVVKLRAQPRLHQLYGFSLNILNLQPAGEGSLRKAAELLAAKLATEGLFDENRKRLLPYPPQKIGLVTSAQSAAYADFMKILQARWAGLEVQLIDVQVQGEAAPPQIVEAIRRFDEAAAPPDVIVIVRGGGSTDDLAAFSTEQVTRAVASSRVPTLVAIGHEVDISLAELAADQRASTPSNAAELLVPDKTHVLVQLAELGKTMERSLTQLVENARQAIIDAKADLVQLLSRAHNDSQERLKTRQQMLKLLDPYAPLNRGYALVSSGPQVVRSVNQLKVGQPVNLRFADGSADAGITSINRKV